MDCLGTCVWTAWVREYGLPGYVRMDCLAVWARAPDHRCVRPAELKPARPQLAVPFLTMECPNNRAVRTIALQACQNVYTVQQPCSPVCSNRDAMPKQSQHAHSRARHVGFLQLLELLKSFPQLLEFRNAPQSHHAHNRAWRAEFLQLLELQKSFQPRISSAPQSHCATQPRGPNSAAPRHGRVVTPAHPPGTTTARPGLRNPAPAPHNRVAVGATAMRSHHSGARQPAPVCALRRIESKGVETGAASRSRRRRAVRAGPRAGPRGRRRAGRAGRRSAAAWRARCPPPPGRAPRRPPTCRRIRAGCAFSGYSLCIFSTYM